MKHHHVSPPLSTRIEDQLPLGVLILDAQFQVCQWNHWLWQQTGISEAEALGKTLVQLFDDFASPRFLSAVQQVIAHETPQVISQALNHFVIPIKTGVMERLGTPYMQQQVVISPLAVLASNGERLGNRAVVCITDVTENVVRANRIIEAAHKLENASNRDELTGLYNRRFMWDWLGQALKHCTRYQQPLACLMLDIDHFKHINHTHGHEAGDQVLIGFAKVVQQQLRTSDVMIRYGGEEFVVLLPNCTAQDAIALAKRMVQNVRDSGIGWLNPGAVTASGGVAVWQQDKPLTGVELLSQADRRLYEAKSVGRNRVMPEGEPGQIQPEALLRE